MKKILLIALILIIGAFGLGAGSGIGSQFKQAKQADKTPQVLYAKDSAKIPEAVAPQQNFELPQTITIPKIKVKANLESVGLDNEKRMDVPVNADSGAWYKLGYKPGQKGNAVIAGHYDKKDGSPAVFWDLAKLAPGDKIIVTDTSGKDLTFEVTRNEKFPYDHFPLKEVFGESSDAMLNLITCEGKWNSATGMYSHRSVIFSKLVQS